MFTSLSRVLLINARASGHVLIVCIGTANKVNNRRIVFLIVNLQMLERMLIIIFALSVYYVVLLLKIYILRLSFNRRTTRLLIENVNIVTNTFINFDYR